jgi:hypothetical protein
MASGQVCGDDKHTPSLAEALLPVACIAAEACYHQCCCAGLPDRAKDASLSAKHGLSTTCSTTRARDASHRIGLSLVVVSPQVAKSTDPPLQLCLH